MNEMFGTINLFEMLGVEAPKEEKKQEKKTKEKKSSAKKPAEYKLPFTIYSGYYEPIVISEVPEGTMDETYVKSVIAEKLPEYVDLMSFIRKNATTGYITLDATKCIQKGIVHLKKESRIFVCGQEYDLSSIMTDAECDADVAEVQKLVSSIEPLMGEKCKLYRNGDKMVARPDLPKNGKLSFPVKVAFVNRPEKDMTISEEAYTAFAEKAELKICLDADGATRPEEQILKKMLAEQIQEYGNYLSVGFYENKPAKESIFCIYYEANSVGAGAGAKAEEKFPVKDTVLSLLFTKIPLSPELFDGAEEVTKGDLIKFLSKDYPEYSSSRTDIVYDKSNKLIMPILKGSKKGAGALISAEEQKELESREYELSYPEIDGTMFRSETLPFGHFSASMEGNYGAFHFYLPKIPARILEVAEAFFAYVTEEYNTEAMLQIFWSPRDRKYELYCPVQSVGHASLSCERDHEKERTDWLIADIHSHGKISCSFSSVDDEDEKGTRLYGVFFGYQNGGFQGFDLRAGCGGYFIPLLEQEVFEPHERLAYTGIDFSDWDMRLFKGGLDMKNRKEFEEKIAELVKASFPEAELTFHEIDKVNTSYRALTVSINSNVGMNINLDAVYEEFENGMVFEQVAARILSRIEESIPNQQKISSDMMDMMLDYDQVKERLFIEVISAKDNTEILYKVPFREFLDMAIVYRISLKDFSDEASALITNPLLERYGITPEQLHADAIKNAPRIRPAIIKGMNEIVLEMYEDGVAEMLGIDELPQDEKMYVAKVPERFLGASVMAYEDFMEMAAEKLGCSFYLLPSSIHEVILVKDDGLINGCELRQMVEEVNSTQVLPEEKLTDSVYHYDSTRHVFELVESLEERRRVSL